MGKRKQMDIEKDAPKIGHNSQLNPDQRRQLSGYVSEVERINDEIATKQSDRANIFKSAKESGFDTAAMKDVIKLRKMEKTLRETRLDTIDAYMAALGMLADTPLGKAAVDREFDDTKVTISGDGIPTIETTGGALRRAADALR